MAPAKSGKLVVGANPPLPARASPRRGFALALPTSNVALPNLGQRVGGEEIFCFIPCKCSNFVHTAIRSRLGRLSFGCLVLNG